MSILHLYDHVYLIVFAFSVLSIFLKTWGTSKRQRSLPPGPPSRPLVGNTHLVDGEFPFIQLVTSMRFDAFTSHSIGYTHRYTALAREYGDIYSLKGLSGTTIILTSASAVKDILDAKGSITGGRVHSHVADRASTLYSHFEILESPLFKSQRKLIKAFLSIKALQGYLPTQKRECLHLLHDILVAPKDLMKHTKRAATSMMTYHLYGKRCPAFENSPASKFFEGIVSFEKAIDDNPLVDIVPGLRFLPGWIASWKTLFSEFEKAYNAGHRTGCFAEVLLEEKARFDASPDEIRAVAMILMDGGADTVPSTVEGLIFALITFPECQRLAQADIDRVVNSHRLPTFDDLERLPYVQALLKEYTRFRPSNPVVVPHVAMEDFTYRGYMIPKGSQILQDTYGIFRDPNMFDEPEAFKPERYLQSQFGTRPGADTSDFRDNFLFGAGRRICPGEEMGTRTIALLAVYLLWAFDFSPNSEVSPTDGLAMDLKHYMVGDILEVRDLPCQVKVRSGVKEELIKRLYAELSP